jgi:protein involved in temperature-dependent protein secretion
VRDLSHDKYTHRKHIFSAIADERKRQVEKWGVQKHPDETGGVSAEHRAWHARMVTESKAESGTISWRDILFEEIAEAFAEADQEKLREELVQVAAVVVAWIEDLDTRLVPVDLSKLGPDD